MTPLNPLAVLKQVLGATALSTLLMTGLHASKRPVVTDFDGWTLRPSIVPPFEREPEQPLESPDTIDDVLSRALARATDYIECIPEGRWGLSSCPRRPNVQFKASLTMVAAANYSDLRTASTTANMAATAKKSRKILLHESTPKQSTSTQ
jgi:hypothetical protein